MESRWAAGGPGEMNLCTLGPSLWQRRPPAEWNGLWTPGPLGRGSGHHATTVPAQNLAEGGLLYPTPQLRLTDGPSMGQGAAIRPRCGQHTRCGRHTAQVLVLGLGGGRGSPGRSGSGSTAWPPHPPRPVFLSTFGPHALL